jgi:hypothetical protein
MLKKPVKSERLGEIRKRERARKDKAWQAAVPPEGRCEVCGMWKPLTGDHVRKRRFMDTRHSPENRRNVCAPCNVSLESLPKGVLMQRFPDSVYYHEWKETIERKRVGYIPGFIPKP